jgi:hypothetical protein
MIKLFATFATVLVSCAALAQAPTPAPIPAAAETPGTKALEEIFVCLAAGLPKDWRTATVEVIDIGTDGGERRFEGRYTYTREKESKTLKLEPCDAAGPAKSVYQLNQYLEPEKRQWKRAILTFRSEGKFDLKYDYTE